MRFADIHTHLLYGTDDGAKTREEMLAMVDAAYRDGARIICATPHFYPSYFGDNRENAKKAFSELYEYCTEKYPDLCLMLGNELAYCHDAISWLKNGACNTLGNTRYILVEFEVEVSENVIAEAVIRLLNAGYIPIIAHAERYFDLSEGRIRTLRENGALIQVNADALFIRFAFRLKRRLKTLFSDRLVDFVSSDTHGMGIRPPGISKAYNILKKKHGDYADDVCFNNANRIFVKNCQGEKNGK